jgi:hypothetical protein
MTRVKTRDPEKHLATGNDVDALPLGNSEWRGKGM